MDSRRKVAPLAEENRDVDFVMLGDFSEGLRKLIVLCLCEGVEFLLVGDGDDGDAAAVLDGDDTGRHGCSIADVQSDEELYRVGAWKMGLKQEKRKRKMEWAGIMRACCLLYIL